MRFLVKAEVFESVVREDDVSRTHHAFAKKVKQIRESGKLLDGGIFADGRGGVFILDVDSARELMSLLAPELVEYCRVETRPLVTFDDLADLFKRQAGA